MIITEPRWKSLIVETTTPLFTPEQCQLIINAGRAEPQESGQVGGGAKGVVDTKTRTSHILVGYHLIRCLKCMQH
jgi:hypothetical protein